MGFFDRWSKNDDGSYTDTQDDSGGGGSSSDSGDSSDTDSTAGSGTSSDPAPGLSGGGGVSDTSPDDSSDGASAGSDDDNPFGGDDSSPDPAEDLEPSVDNDNPFDDSDGSSGGSSDDGGSNPPVGNTPSSGNLPSQDGGSSSSGNDSNDTDSTAGSGTSSDPAPGLDGGGGVSNTSGDSSDGSDVPVGNTPGSGNLPSQSGDSPDTGQGIGPDGVSGSEAATPDSETDAPTNDSTDTDATRTGRLEDTASDPQVRERAKNLEDEVVGEQITDSVDGLKTTGAEYRDEDIEVVPVDEEGNVVDSMRDADRIKRQLSPVGEERVENIADRQQEEAAERAIEDDLNTAFDDSDVSVNDDGSVDVSEDVRQEAVKQEIASNNAGVREDDIQFDESGGAFVEQQNQQEQTNTGQNQQEQPEQVSQPNPDAVSGLSEAAGGLADLDPESVESGLRETGQAITQSARQNQQNLQDTDLEAQTEGSVLEDAAGTFESGTLTFGRDPDDLGTDIAAVGNVAAAGAEVVESGQNAEDLLGTGLGGAVSGNPSEFASRSVGEAVDPANTTTTDEALEEDAVQAGASAAAAATAARENPGTTSFRVALGGATGVGSGLGAGRGVRSVRAASRTRGLDEFDAGDLTNQETLDFYEGRNADPENRFPGFDEDTLQDQGAEAAFRQQSDEFTPGVIEQEMTTKGVDTTKGLDVEPDGGSEAFRTQAGDYESPGASVGPELSPNFLGLDDASSGAPQMSFRPGLPDSGNQPTAAVIRTDVEGRPDIDSTGEFNQYLRNNEGDTTATIPDPTSRRTDVNPGEAEAVIAPDAEFVSAGKDFKTEIDGQTVPVRTYERPDGPLDVDSPAGRDPGAGSSPSRYGRPGRSRDVTDPLDDTGPAGRDPAAPADVDVGVPRNRRRGDTDTSQPGRETRTVRDIERETEAPRQPTDRPSPVPTGGSSPLSGGRRGSGGRGDPAGVSQPGFGQSDSSPGGSSTGTDPFSSPFGGSSSGLSSGISTPGSSGGGFDGPGFSGGGFDGPGFSGGGFDGPGSWVQWQ